MENENFKILYAGYADKIDGKDKSWKVIQDNEDSRKIALEEGYTAFTTTSFSYEPEAGQPEPIRYGSLFMDIDCKSDPTRSIKFAREFILYRLHGNYGVNLSSLKYWISGGKGCHIEIPAETFGGESGHPYLPLIYKDMMKFMTRRFRDKDLENIVDLQMYNMGKGRLLRCENIMRPNGRYKVQVSAGEMLNLEVEQLLAMTDKPRFDLPFVTEPPHRTGLAYLYESSMNLLNLLNKNKHAKLGLNSLLECGFLEHCWTNRQALSEPEWWAMVGVLMAFGEEARPIVHLFSQGYEGYSEEETDKKIRQWQVSMKSLSCSYLKTLHDCGKSCGVSSPRYLWQKQHAQNVRSASDFILNEDGVYYISDQEASNNKQFICTPLKVLGKLRSPESLEWSRLVEFRDSDGIDKKVVINMCDCVGRGDVVRAQLAYYGVEFSGLPKAQSLFMEYLRTSAPAGKLFVRINKVGWQGDTYMLPDAIFGEPFRDEIYFESSLANLHQVAGSLDDWKENVGKYCRGNSLLVLLTSYALTGPLLRPCGFEGGGLHVYGSSSSGKSTAAHVAGSVCGGGGHKGFMRQWNSTHNAIENTAVLHDDNLLVLDEIGQASAETVAHIPYMLANGQGKARMKADASARNIERWLLNFISNGELTINDKIQETGKFTSHVGQEVRAIDLPIGGGNGQDLYENMHGYDDGARLSDDLVKNCMKYYGSPLRAFLEAFCGSCIEEKQRHIELINEKAQKFVQENCPAEASGQIRRVCRKFGLIASAGEFAHECGILPYGKGEAWSAAGKWFKIWLTERDSIGDLEIAKGLRKIQEHFAVESESRYVPVENALIDTRAKKAGYSWTEKSGRKKYFMLVPVFNEILKGTNRKVLLDEMNKLGWLDRKKDGSVRDKLNNSKVNVRGYAFMPEVWEGKAEPGINSRTGE